MGTDNIKPIITKLAHTSMGHINKMDSRKPIKYLGCETVRGAMSPYNVCAEAKAKVKRRQLPTRVKKVITVIRPKVKTKAVNEYININD
eukprot:4137073-Ditylum_brightwellii.AAC.1